MKLILSYCLEKVLPIFHINYPIISYPRYRKDNFSISPFFIEPHLKQTKAQRSLHCYNIFWFSVFLAHFQILCFSFTGNSNELRRIKSLLNEQYTNMFSELALRSEFKSRNVFVNTLYILLEYKRKLSLIADLDYHLTYIFLCMFYSVSVLQV